MQKQYILTEEEAKVFQESTKTIKGLESLLDLAHLRIELLEKENSSLKTQSLSQANRIKSLEGALAEAKRDLVGTTQNLDMAESQIKSLRGIIQALKDESL